MHPDPSRTRQLPSYASHPWMSQVFLEIADGVQLTSDGNNRWLLRHGEATVPFHLPEGRVASVLSRLVEKTLPLFDTVEAPSGGDGHLSVQNQLQKLWRYGLLVQVLHVGEQRAALLRNFGEVPLLPDALDLSEQLVLSEDVCIRRHRDVVVVEPVEFGALIEITHRRFIRLLIELTTPSSLEALLQATGLPRESATAFLVWLNATGVIRAATTDGRLLPHREAAVGWSFADRLTHSRSRMGHHVGGYGATFPLKGKVAVPPALKSSTREILALPAPESGGSIPRDAHFLSILHNRRSIREHDSSPMTLEQLGEFLHHVARVKRLSRSGEYEVAMRPYPSGGALFELEFYPLINKCGGLKQGLYRYEPAAHGLEDVSGVNAHTMQILLEAKRGCGMRSEPHVLIILAARFLRVNWKYESMSYSLILKNVGAAYQTMYLVATAMGLAPCALGGGNSSLFCKAAGTEYWQESSVGEFFLGRPRSDS